jgi:hypothetical protein
VQDGPIEARTRCRNNRNSKQHWDEYDFFFALQVTDSAGEDSDFARKQDAIAQFTRAIPSIVALKPNVLVVTGDHSTPASMAALFHQYCCCWGRLVYGYAQFTRGTALGGSARSAKSCRSRSHADRLARRRMTSPAPAASRSVATGR